MSTMDISLPDSLKTFVDEQVSQRGYGTRSEYVRELILKDQQGKQLSCLLLEGASSASAGLADAAYFEFRAFAASRGRVYRVNRARRAFRRQTRS